MGDLIGSVTYFTIPFPTSSVRRLAETDTSIARGPRESQDNRSLEAANFEHTDVDNGSKLSDGADAMRVIQCSGTFAMAVESRQQIEATENEQRIQGYAQRMLDQFSRLFFSDPTVLH